MREEAGSGGGEHPARRYVTREEVARLAGVSTAVVSYVVNNGPRPVAKATAKRVRDAVAKLGYRPNANARALRRGRSETIGLILTDATNPFYIQYTFELVKIASDRGKRLLIGDARHDEKERAAIIEEMIERQVDGLLFASTGPLLDHRGNPFSVNLPTVFIDRPTRIAGERSVGSMAEAGAFQLVSHLIQHGSRRVAIIVGASGYGNPDPREAGWKKALAEAGLPTGPVARAPFTREGGYAACLALLSAHPKIDAIFASNDLQAVGAVKALHESGVRIPGDLAIGSFDGTKESEFCWPPLTTAQQDLPLMSAASLDLLGEPVTAEGSRIEIPTRLILRASCGCAEISTAGYPHVELEQPGTAPNPNCLEQS